MFVDADCEISNSWISDAAKILLSDDKIGVVGGAYLPDDLAPGSTRDLQFALASPLISLGSIQHRPKKRQSKVSSIPAGVLAVRKKIINEIGAFESGAVAKWLGTVTSVVIGGIATLVVVAITSKVGKAIRNCEL